MADQQRSEETIFVAALDKRTPEDRAAYLAAACGADADLRTEVEKLLDAHDNPVALLDLPALGVEPSTDDTVAAEGPGTVIGHYKLLELIGEGGFGDVYMAEQQEPVRRQVALKIIKLGMDTKQVIARFEAEQQALAIMDHPNIAKVFEAGATDSGRPYFVMELVHGVPITEHCDNNRLTTRQRLGLFIDVCHAVQHAHQKGIIHRDIKPTNVMVTQIDGRAVPKVIDFGIAKATNRRLTEKTLFTSYAQVVGTPEYMSPEQAQMSGVDVDTRTDIYSLGVLLYELLTGSTPLDKGRLREAGFEEVLRKIREEEPPPPSMRISTLGAAATTVSMHRNTDPAKLSNALHGEIDWIVLKALDKDRSRRYGMAGALTADIERYLSDEPVTACPPSTVYRLQKFARRNKTILTTVLLVSAAMLIGTTVSIWQAIEANQARDLADQRFVEADGQRQRAEANLRLARQAVDDMYTQVAERWLRDEPQMTLVQQEFLEKALSFYEEFTKLNGTDPELLYQIGKSHWRVARIYRRQTRDPESERACRKAIAIFRKLVADFPEEPLYRHELGVCYIDLGWVLDALGYTNESEAVHRQAVLILNEIAESSPANATFRSSLARGLNELGNRLNGLERDDEAEVAYRRSLETYEKLVSDFPGEIEYRRGQVCVLHSLAVLWQDEQRLLEVATRLEELVAEFRNVACYRHWLADTYGHLRHIYRSSERHEEGRDLLRREMTIREELVADYPQDMSFKASLVGVWVTRAHELVTDNSLEEAESFYRKAIGLLQECVGPNVEHKLAQSYHGLGRLLETANRLEEAETAYRRGAALMEKVAAESPRYQSSFAASQNRLARLLNRIAHLQADTSHSEQQRAIKLALEAAKLVPQQGRYSNTLGIARYRADDWKGAIKALDRSEKVDSKGKILSANAFFLAMAHWRLGRKTEALKSYDRAVRWMDENQPGDEQLRRFRAEAAALLGIDNADAPDQEKAETTTNWPATDDSERDADGDESRHHGYTTKLRVAQRTLGCKST